MRREDEEEVLLLTKIFFSEKGRTFCFLVGLLFFFAFLVSFIRIRNFPRRKGKVEGRRVEKKTIC